MPGAIPIETPEGVPIELPITNAPGGGRTPPPLHFDIHHNFIGQFLRFTAPKYVVTWAHSIAHLTTLGIDDLSGAVSWAYHSVAGFFGHVAHVDMVALSGFVNTAVTTGLSLMWQTVSPMLSAIASEVSALGTWIEIRSELAFRRITQTASSAVALFHQAESAAYSLVVGVAASIERDIARVERGAYKLAGGVAAGVEAWAIDHIAHPLLKDIAAAEARAKVEIGTAVGVVRDDLSKLLHSDITKVLAEVAAVAAVATTVASWVDDCGEPMCQSIGPKTDLGKLLKLLSVAEAGAFAVELAQLDEQGVENLLRGLVHLAGGITDEFRTLFVEGGGTLGGAITGSGG